MQETTYSVQAPCSIALLSDLHNRPCGQILQSLANRRPDMICITGDLVHDAGQEPLPTQTNALELLKGCSGLAPTFLSVGNHDWFLTPDDFEYIQNLGVTVLDNAWTTCQGIHIGGLTSAITIKARQYGDPDYPCKLDPDTCWLDEFEQLPGRRILLCHHPEYEPEYLRARSLDLILSGHAHGGQWRFFGRGVLAPGQGWFPKLTAGVHDRLVISRGLANTGGIIPRINNPTELVYLK